MSSDYILRCVGINKNGQRCKHHSKYKNKLCERHNSIEQQEKQKSMYKRLHLSALQKCNKLESSLKEKEKQEDLLTERIKSLENSKNEEVFLSERIKSLEEKIDNSKDIIIKEIRDSALDTCDVIMESVDAVSSLFKRNKDLVSLPNRKSIQFIGTDNRVVLYKKHVKSSRDKRMAKYRFGLE